MNITFTDRQLAILAWKAEQRGVTSEQLATDQLAPQIDSWGKDFDNAEAAEFHAALTSKDASIKADAEALLAKVKAKG